MRQSLLRLIGAAQLFGVVLLVAAQILALRQDFQFSTTYVTGVVVAGVLTSYASVLLLLQSPVGLRLSAVVQALQVFNVSTAAFSYQVALGPVARLHLMPDGWLTQFGAYGNVGIVPGPLMSPSPTLTVNFFALFALLVLLRRAGVATAPAAVSAPAG